MSSGLSLEERKGLEEIVSEGRAELAEAIAAHERLTVELAERRASANGDGDASPEVARAMLQQADAYEVRRDAAQSILESLKLLGDADTPELEAARMEATAALLAQAEEDTASDEQIAHTAAKSAERRRLDELNEKRRRIAARDTLSRWLGRAVAGVTQYGRDVDAEFDLHLDGESVRLGSADDVLNRQGRVRAALAARAGVVAPTSKAAEWAEVAGAIIELADVVDTGATQDAETRAWVLEYLSSYGASAIVELSDREALHSLLDDDYTSRVFCADDERLYVHVPSLHEKLSRVGHRLTSTELGARLARLGFEKRRLTARRADGSQARRQLWQSPHGFAVLDEEDVAT